MKSLFKFGIATALMVAIASLPLSLSAQTNSAPAATKKEVRKSEKKAKTIPFKGLLAAIDKTAKTISVGEKTQRVFQVTSETKIFKNGKPALLEDGVVGEVVTGSYKAAADGKLNANSVYYGGKTAPNAEKKKAEKTENEKPKPAQQ